MHSITFEHRYLLRRTLPSRPPLYLTPLAPSTSFSRYPSLSLSLSPSLSPPFSRALALTPSLPAADAPTPLSHSCPLSNPLYARECTSEAKFKDRHASTFSYTNVHLGGPAGTTGTTPRCLHHPSSSSARRVSRSSPLSFSLPLSLSLALLRTHFSSLSFALSLAVALAPAARPSSLADVEREIGATDDGRTRGT